MGVMNTGVCYNIGDLSSNHQVLWLNTDMEPYVDIYLQYIIDINFPFRPYSVQKFPRRKSKMLLLGTTHQHVSSIKDLYCHFL